MLDLFGPEGPDGDRGPSLAENDDAFVGSCFFDSRIKSFRLPVDGGYLIVATSFLQRGGGHYKLQLTCENNACALPGAPTLQRSRIAQTDIDRGVFTPDELFEIGDFTFETVFRVEDGMGNALNGAPAGTRPRPNFRQIPNNVHFAAFGAPEAQSCVTCHNVGGDDGAGDVNHNIFQIGDGINRNSGVPRNQPTVLGNGYRQAIQDFLRTLGRDEDPKVRAFVATDVPKNIPDNNATGVSSVIDVPPGLDVQHVTVSTNITHTFRGDLVIQVIAPNGQTATLSNRAGGSADNFVAANQDISASFTAGSTASGPWRLFVRDLAAIDIGTINAFSLVISSTH